MSNIKTSSLLPNGLEIIAYLIFSVFVLAAINAKRIWEHASEGIAVNPVDLGTNVNIYWQKIDGLWHSSFVGTASVMMFWGVVGSLVYAGIWLMQNTLLKIRQDEDLVAREQQTNRGKGVIQSVFAHYLFFVAMTIIIVAYIFFFIAVILPSTKLLFFSAVISSLKLQDIASFAGTIVAFSLALYILVVLITLYTRFWRQYLKPNW